MKKILELAPIVFVSSLIIIIPFSVAVICGKQSTQHSIYTYVFFNTKENALNF